MKLPETKLDDLVGCTGYPGPRRSLKEMDDAIAEGLGRGGPMPKTSVGILAYRLRKGELQVFLVHPGGPFWARKDHGAWSIPKGELGESEDPLEAAKRELREETGFEIEGELVALTPWKQPGGKVMHAWAVEADFDPSRLISNTFVLEWPKGSGRQREFPEVDRAEWFDLEEAKRRLLAGQVGFLDELAAVV